MDVIALAKVGRLSWSIPARTFVGWEPFYPKVSRTRIIAFYPLSPGKRLRFFGFASFLYIVCYPHSYYVVQRFNFPLIPLYFLSSSTLRVQLKASQLTLLFPPLSRSMFKFIGRYRFLERQRFGRSYLRSSLCTFVYPSASLTGRLYQ